MAEMMAEFLTEVLTFLRIRHCVPEELQGSQFCVLESVIEIHHDMAKLQPR